MTRDDLARLAPGDPVDVRSLGLTPHDARQGSRCVVRSVKAAGAFVSPRLGASGGASSEEFFLAQEMERA